MDSLESINSSSKSLSHYLNISNLGLSNESFDINPDTERKFKEIFLEKKLKNPQKFKKSSENPQFSTFANSNSELNGLSNEISTLKQTLTELISQMNHKDKENNKSCENLRKLAFLSKKNKKKIKKLKETVNFHQVKIMSLENNLNFIYGIFSDRHLRDNKNLRPMFVEKSNAPSAKLRSYRGVNLMIKGPSLRSKGIINN